MSITNTTTTTTSDSLIPQDGASAITDDEDDMWLAMAMTFNDLYQGLTENNIPSLEEANVANGPTNNDDGVVKSGQIFASSEQVEEGKNRLSTQFHHVFRRVIEIDQAGNKSISYVTPDKITKLTSREETERFLDQNPTLDVSISQFCWVDLIIGFEDPTWETVHVQDHRQRHSLT